MMMIRKYEMILEIKYFYWKSVRRIIHHDILVLLKKIFPVEDSKIIFEKIWRISRSLTPRSRKHWIENFRFRSADMNICFKSDVSKTRIKERAKINNYKNNCLDTKTGYWKQPLHRSKSKAEITFAWKHTSKEFHNIMKSIF